MKQTDFTVENKLPLPAIFFLVIMSIKEIIKRFWAIGVLLLAKEWKNKTALLVQFFIVLAIIIGLSILRGVLMYLNFKYIVKDDELIVKKGILKKTVLNIPLHRIQNISITQGFWQQVLNITTLSVDTAGTAGKEMEIYLDKVTSNALKEFLNKSRAEIINDELPVETEQNQQLIKSNDEKLTYIYSKPQLIVSAISRNHIKGFGLFIALAFAFLSQLGDKVIERVITTVEPVVYAKHTLTFWIFVIIFIFLLSIIVNFFRISLKYYDLTVKLYSDRIKYNGGLIQKMEQIINLDKIQIIRETTNLLEKAFNVSSLKLLQFLTLNEKSKNDIKFDLPGFWKSQELTHAIYTDLGSDQFSEFYPQQNYLLRNFYLYALYPSLILALGSFLDIKMFLPAVLWIVIGSFCAYFRYKKSKSEVGGEYIRISSGMLGEIISTIKIKNIQSITFKQSVFQERSKTASVIIATRWDNMIIPFIQEEDAKKICNYLLYKIEC